jgi:Protein of unknown function (DUF3124)
MRTVWLTFFCFCLLAAGTPALAQGADAKSKGQLLYLPIYSHVWHGDADTKGVPLKSLVSVLVSIRNTDPAKSIRVVSAQYYDTAGKKLHDYIKGTQTIGPLGTHELYVPRSETAGGSGAKFVISWQADAPANPPLVEALHLNLPGGRSIAFTTIARPILPE